MSLKITIVRHGETKSNALGRYVGKSLDEGLSEEGKKKLKDIWQKPLDTDIIYVSPMKRCKETAHIIAPDMGHNVIEKLAECNFGDFEGKTHEELKDLEEFKEFQKSGGTAQIPNGECGADFQRRCIEGFLEIVDDMVDSRMSTSAIICHGGTIMSILSHFDKNNSSFYDFMVENGRGYEVEFDIYHSHMDILKKI